MSTAIHPDAQLRRPANRRPADRLRDFLDTLYRRYARLFRFLSRRRVEPEDARDIVQETYCRPQQVGAVEAMEFPRAYLFRTAYNPAPNGRQVLKGQQELAIIRQALAELNPKCRRVFVMSRFEGATYPRIAAELGVPVSTIEKYVSQALAHLKTRLDDESVRAGALTNR